MSGHGKSDSLYERIQETSSYLQKHNKRSPRFGLILGTGLGGVAEQIEDAESIPFADIPNFMSSTSEGHAGNLVFGKLGSLDVVVMQGRVHYYEGYSMEQVTFPVRVMKALGVDSLVVSNAAGGMNPQLAAGDIVAVNDMINLMGDGPLRGPNDERLGERFPDMSEPFDRAYLDLIGDVALQQHVQLHRGVFVAVAGPNLETAAEYRFLRLIGADVVGMSLIPETIVARHSSMRVLALTVVTDECFPDRLEPADVAKIIRTANEAAPKLTELILGFLRRAESH